MRDWTNWLFYGIAGCALVLTWFAADELESRLQALEYQLDMQAIIIDKLRQGE